MSLTSPRFTSSDTLKKVDANLAVLQKGSEGRAVHLVQMALLDLGYKLPLSTGKKNYSPDGIYGEETKQAVKKFQQDSKTVMLTLIGFHSCPCQRLAELNASDFANFG